MHTRPRCDWDDDQRKVNALRVEPKTEPWSCRVTGDDAAEVICAANLIGATVALTKQKRYWFRATAEQLPTIREKHVLATGDLSAWLWLFRPRSEYFCEGAAGVDFTYDEMGGGNMPGTSQDDGEAGGAVGTAGVDAVQPPGGAILPDGPGSAAGGYGSGQPGDSGGELYPDSTSTDAGPIHPGGSGLPEDRREASGYGTGDSGD